MALVTKERPDVETLVAVIARSPIVVVPGLSKRRLRALPENFDEADLAILDWIAAEGRRAGRSLVRM